MLDGPRRPPRSGRAVCLIVLLHGYGADGDDLIDLADTWADALPGAAFVSPHAPEPCPGSPTGRQWWDLGDRDMATRHTGVARAAAALDPFLDAELARLGVASDAYALMGFSQGAMTALHTGLRRPIPPRAILAYSGMLIDPPPSGVATEVLLVHGTEDPVIPADASRAAATALAAARVPTDLLLLPGLAHGIDPGGLARGGALLARTMTER